MGKNKDLDVSTCSAASNDSYATAFEDSRLGDEAFKDLDTEIVYEEAEFGQEDHVSIEYFKKKNVSQKDEEKTAIKHIFLGMVLMLLAIGFYKFVIYCLY